jgi:hypothetical protein
MSRGLPPPVKVLDHPLHEPEQGNHQPVNQRFERDRLDKWCNIEATKEG